jgi:hypothetical protein
MGDIFELSSLKSEETECSENLCMASITNTIYLLRHCDMSLRHCDMPPPLMAGQWANLGRT